MMETCQKFNIKLDITGVTEFTFEFPKNEIEFQNLLLTAFKYTLCKIHMPVSFNIVRSYNSSFVNEIKNNMNEIDIASGRRRYLIVFHDKRTKNSFNIVSSCYISNKTDN